MTGEGLLQFLIEASGLPPEKIKPELERRLAAKAFSASSLTLEQVREVLEDLLHESMNDAKGSLI
jgi:hypothetical protein